MRYTIGKSDSQGYYFVMEDGVILCHTKSLGVAKRILRLLAVAALAENVWKGGDQKQTVFVDLDDVEDLDALSTNNKEVG